MNIPPLGSPIRLAQQKETTPSEIPHGSLLPIEDRLTTGEAGELVELQQQSLDRANAESNSSAMTGFTLMGFGALACMANPLFGVPIAMCGAGIAAISLLEKKDHHAHYQENLQNIERLALPHKSADADGWNVHQQG